MSHGEIPKTPLKPKEAKPVEDIAKQLVGYQATIQEAGDYLDSQRRLTKAVADRFHTEIMLLGRILQGIFGMPKPVWETLQKEVRSHPDFHKEAVALANAILPEPNKIISPDACKEEILKMKAQGKYPWAL